MRWNTGITHNTKNPPVVTLVTYPNPDTEPEVRIDIRGGGIYLTIAEARNLAADLLATVTPGGNA